MNIANRIERTGLMIKIQEYIYSFLNNIRLSKVIISYFFLKSYVFNLMPVSNRNANKKVRCSNGEPKNLNYHLILIFI